MLQKYHSYELTNFELTNRYDATKVSLLEKFDSNTIISAVYYEGSNKEYYVKRFQIETSTLDKAFSFIGDASGSKLAVVSTDARPQISYKVPTGKGNQKEDVQSDLSELIDVKGWKALGNKLDRRKVTSVKLLEVELPSEDQPEKSDSVPQDLKTGDTVEWSEDDLNGQGQLF